MFFLSSFCNEPIVDSTGISQTGKSAIALWGNQTVNCENVVFDMSLTDSSAISGWWDTGIGTTINVKNCVFNCNGQRPLRTCGNITVEGCTFNDPYRYAIQLTGKAGTATELEVATVVFEDNVINNGANGKSFVYGIQLEGETYGCNDLVINGSGNTINAGEWDTNNESAMYYCECGKVDHSTIVWNTEVAAKHDCEEVYTGILKTGAKTYEIVSKEGLLNLQSLLTSLSPNEANIITVNLCCDVDLTGEDWAPIVAMWVTFNGNGHTISNLTAGFDSTGRRSGFWSYAGAVTINDLTLENVNVTGSQAGIFAGSAEGFKANNCVVKGTNTVTFKAGVETWNGIGAITGVLTNSTVNVEIAEGATVTLYKDESFTTDTGCVFVDELTGHISNNNGTVTNNGTVKTVTTIADIDTVAELEKALETAGAAGAGNTTISLSGNIAMAEAWTPIKVDGYHGADIVTIEGNGATITGLTAPLFAGGFAGGSGIVIKDLTIADSNIVSSNTIGSGAFIESVDSMAEITLINCHLKNSTVTGGDGSRTGGLIGWTAGYNNVNDGPVKTYVTIEDCSVVECEITCNGSVGGIYGHAGNNAWTYSTVKNCTVTGCKLASTDDGGWRVGVVVGTANVGELTISGITESGNTLTQTGKTAPEGQSNLYGRFVPGETGKLVIEGAEIQ